MEIHAQMINGSDDIKEMVFIIKSVNCMIPLQIKYQSLWQEDSVHVRDRSAVQVSKHGEREKDENEKK